ncbi:MAG: hypothetical protein E6K10_01760 [Methanobacteriota archaeon]|nr:MAG: hypothetical protein E6K10_01760 [Euryarchaeota archaeon]
MKRLTRGRIATRLGLTVGAMAIVGLFLATGIGSALEVRGYFNDRSTPAVQNSDFRSGTSNWVLERGNAARSDSCAFGPNYYRSSPDAPYSLCVWNNNDYVALRQDVSSATINQVMGGGVTFNFWFRSTDDSAWAEIAWKARYWDWGCWCYRESWFSKDSDVIPASVESGDAAWASASVSPYIHWGTTQMYVRIFVNDFNRDVSRRFVRAYVDDARLSLSQSLLGDAGWAYGKGNLLLNVWQVDDDPSNYLYKSGYLSVAIAGRASDPYRVQTLEIQVELEPQYDDCWWIFCTHKTSQDGTATVLRIAEANERNVPVNPAEQQAARDTSLMLASIGAGVLLSVAAAPLGFSATSLAIGAAGAGGTSLLFRWLGESTQGFDTMARGPGEDYYTRIRWDYQYTTLDTLDPTKYSRFATGTNDLFWNYRAGEGSYRLKVGATITWGEPVCQWENLLRHNVCNLQYRAQSTFATWVDV